MRDAPSRRHGAVAARRAVRVVAGGAPEADGAGMHFEVVVMAVVFGGATIFFGIVPQPLFDFAQHAARSLGIY